MACSSVAVWRASALMRETRNNHRERDTEEPGLTAAASALPINAKLILFREDIAHGDKNHVKLFCLQNIRWPSRPGGEWACCPPRISGTAARLSLPSTHGLGNITHREQLPSSRAL